MYKIYLGNYPIYDLRDDEYIVTNPNLELEVNKLGSLSFGILPEHPYFDNLIKRKSVLTVYKDDKVIYKGYIISDEQGMFNDKKIECEGVLGYLNDSIVRPYSFNGTPQEHFINLFDNHNNQAIGNLFDKNNFKELNANIKDGLINSAPAERTLYIKCEKNTTYTFKKLRGNQYPRFTIAETTDIPTIGSACSNSYYSTEELQTYTTSSNAEYLVFWYYCNDSELTKQEVLDSLKIVKGSIDESKVLKVGTITVTDPNDYIVRSSVDYASTWEVLNDDLISKLGGYLRVRYEDDGTYVDYLEDFDDTSTQVIEFGENLIDVLVKNDAADVYTVVIPLGAEIQNEDGTTEQLTIKSVNNDLDYLVNQEAYEQYGWIVAPVDLTTWDDVTVADNLKTKGTKFLNNEAVMLKSTLDVSAIDLNVTDKQIEAFFIYEYVRFVSSIHNINKTYLLSKISIPMDAPENMKITLGSSESSLTGIQMGNGTKVDNLVNRIGIVEKDYTISNQKIGEIESAIEYFSVDLAQYNITIPTDNNKIPLETKSYNINFYAYYKGNQVIPEVSIKGSNTGITTTKTDDYISFVATNNTAIPNILNEYTITFTYTVDGSTYTLNKKVDIAIVLNGADGTSVNILGSYDTLEALQTAHPTGNVGDAYIVNGDLHVWCIENNSWQNVGQIQGQAGADGKSAYLHIRYSDDGTTFTANSGITVGRYRGELVNENPIASTTFSDYTWYDMALLVEDELNSIREEVQTNLTSIQQSQEEILMTALQDYVATSDFETFQNTISTQFSQTAESFDFNFNNLSSQINTLNGETQQQFQEFNSYFRIEQDGVEIGRSDSDIVLKQQNDRISFIQSNNEVAYISNNELFITDARFLNSLRIGNFALKPRANGNLSLVYVGGEQA